MSKLTWDNVIKNAMTMLAHANEYAYLYGCDGETGTDALVDKQVKLYPEHFKGMDIPALKNYVRGKKCYDCSGAVHTWFGAPDMNSTTLINSCKNVRTDLVAGVAGSVLWKSGHVGLDIGYGYFVHFPAEFRTIELAKISEYGNWTKTGQLTGYCDYTGASAR